MFLNYINRNLVFSINFFIFIFFPFTLMSSFFGLSFDQNEVNKLWKRGRLEKIAANVDNQNLEKIEKSRSRSDLHCKLLWFVDSKFNKNREKKFLRNPNHAGWWWWLGTKITRRSRVQTLIILSLSLSLFLHEKYNQVCNQFPDNGIVGSRKSRPHLLRG